jgi:hypothetical protein
MTGVQKESSNKLRCVYKKKQKTYLLRFEVTVLVFSVVIYTVGISQESLGDPLDLDFQTEQYKSYKRTKNLAIHEPVFQMVLQDNLMWFCPLLLLYQCMPQWLKQRQETGNRCLSWNGTSRQVRSYLPSPCLFQLKKSHTKKVFLTWPFLIGNASDICPCALFAVPQRTTDSAVSWWQTPPPPWGW